jgi:hypothetical protein
MRILLFYYADSDPNPTFHSNANPDHTFQFDTDLHPHPTTHFYPDLDPPFSKAFTFSL